MGAARHLTSLPNFDRETGEVVESSGCRSCDEKADENEGLKKTVSSQAGTITSLKRDLAQMQGVEPGSDDIREVLEYAREQTGRSRARIIPGSPAWKAVKARLADRDVDGDQVFTVFALKLAVDGAMRSDWHVRHKQLKPETIFGDAGKVEVHIERMLDWEARLQPILKLPVALEQANLDFLAKRCECGHTRLEHSVIRWDSPMCNWVPCIAEGCPCVDFDDFHADDPRWLGSPAWREENERRRREAA